MRCGPRGMAAPHLPRRKSSVSAIYYPKRRSTKVAARDSIRTDDGSDDTPRRMSGELISMKDFLSANKVSLALMQKQLYETAQMNRAEDISTAPTHQPIFKPAAVGPLAIASEKFQDNSTVR